ncbi:F-box domain-containing protein [Pseudohyphozyma bogoriensis]|nr:F-box domain-containing protein [Pseudohyphozyma bogoriensis]
MPKPLGFGVGGTPGAGSGGPKSAVELYGLAVASEREGRLNDALLYYRQSFRLDPSVDRAYHRSQLASATTASTTRSTSPPRDPHAPSHPGEFKFERTVQLTADYAPNKEMRSAGEGEEKHPSSTRWLRKTLVESFEENDFLGTVVKNQGDLVVGAKLEDAERIHRKKGDRKTDDEPALSPYAFHPMDPSLPLYLSKLPQELLLHILELLLLSPVLPPKPKPVDEPASSVIPIPTVRGKKVVKLSTKEERWLAESEIGWEGDGEVGTGDGRDEGREGRWDVEALERFARVCRFARVLSLDEGLWRKLVNNTYVAPFQISREESAAQLVKELHASDWRRCYIEHPRLRYDGVYIAVVTYLRRGESQTLYSPTHLITFYRYFRFYASGLVLSLLTTDPPNVVVRQFNPALRLKGFTRGKWRLRGEGVECWGLEDPGVAERERKYAFRCGLRLRSTARGRMNKLEMLTLATEHRVTRELEDVPIRPTKPFFFSKVASYAGADETNPQIHTGGLSLWLSPPPSSPLYALLQKLSHSLNTVSFQPHATLVADDIVPAHEDLVERIKKGVQTWRDEGNTTLELGFQDVRQGDKFYQCVLAALSPNPSLFSLHQHLLSAFDVPIPSPPTYFPHLSLIYADLSPTQKSNIINDLWEIGEVANTEDQNGVEIAGVRGFEPTEILLVRTAGPPPTWEILDRVPLDAQKPPSNGSFVLRSASPTDPFERPETYIMLVEETG